MAQEISHAASAGTEMAIVVGAGNIFRGVSGASKGMDRATADYMGMLATVMNSMALQDALGKLSTPSRGCCRPSRCRRCASPTSGGGPSATWRRAGWSSSRGHRQPLLQHRHRRGAPRPRDRGGVPAHGQEEVRRDVSPPTPRPIRRRPMINRDHSSGSPGTWSPGDGLHEPSPSAWITACPS